MKTFSRFRNLTPYNVAPEKHKPFKVLRALCEDLEAFGEAGIDRYKCHDPSAGSRESMGLFGVGGEYFRDIDGKGILLTLQFAKRNLPARVIADRVDEMADAVFQQTGRKPGRKERREMAEDAELALLPRAFINYSYVPVIFTSDQRLFIFTGTSKRVDATLSFLVSMLIDLHGCMFGLSRPANDINIGTEAWMTSKAIGIFDDSGDLQVTDYALMKADESSKMRVSDRSLSHSEVQDALKVGWRVNQIGLSHTPSGMTFRLDDNFTLRSITMGSDAALEMKEDGGDNNFDEIQAVAWLVVTEFRNIIDALVADMRGAAPAVEDDEL